MSGAKDGGAAFPANPNNAHCEPGMSLRDYIATQALAALISQSGDGEFRVHTDKGILIVPARQAAPIVAYEYADAMLAARTHTEGE